MFKGLKTTLIIVTSLVFGYTLAALSGCNHAPGHGHDGECDSTKVCCDSTKLDTVVVEIADLTITVADSISIEE